MGYVDIYTTGTLADYITSSTARITDRLDYVVIIGSVITVFLLVDFFRRITSTRERR